MWSNTFKFAFTLLLLIQSFKQECNTGCLKCTQDSECLLCDLTKNMRLVDGVCQNFLVSNCEAYSINGECLRCISNYFLDTAQKKCVAISSEQAIANCDIYSNSTTCLKCANKYYLSGITCQAITITVENCAIYSGDGLCLECNFRNILSIDNKKCHPINEINKCQTYSSIRCLTCQENLYQQSDAKNQRIKSLLKANDINKVQSAIQLLFEVVQTSENNCFVANSQNCKVLANFEECGACNDGYYVKNGSCVKNPEEAIHHCLRYTNLNKCHTCQEGYHLTLEYQCQPDKFVQNCFLFNGAAYDQTECVQCEELFYLAQKNYCQKRTIFEIQNCKELHRSKDGCGECSDGFLSTTDNLACLPIIENCQDYFNSYQNDKSLVCLQCIEGHYINDEGQCAFGSIGNCKIYQRTSDQCKVCQDQFYLDKDNTCQQHTVINKCDKYHPLLNKKCLECSFDSYLINTATQCVQTIVQNCQKHIRKDYCGECKDLFMLDNNGKCIDMSTTNPNCLRGEYNVCRKCKDGYILEKGKCVQTYGAITQNCEIKNFKDFHTKNFAECEICKAQNIPYNFKGSYMCMENTMLTSQGYNANITDCLSYRIDKDNNLKCTECGNNKQIGLDGTCTTQTCTQQVYSHLIESDLDKVKIVHKNQCKTDNSSKCQKYGIKQKLFPENKQIEFGCTECKSNNGAFVMIKKTDQNFSYVDNQRFKWKVNIDCYTNIELSQWMISTDMTNCEYFYMLGTNAVGCLKCKPGKYGSIKNYLIENCASHDPKTTLCNYCQKNYYLNPDKTRCLKSLHVDNTGTNLSHMNNCKSMAFDQDKCYECKSGYFLNDNGTTCTQFNNTIPNCSSYVHNASSNIPKCAVCETGYTLYNNQANCFQDSVNCLEKSSNTVCTKCKDNYYLLNDACVQVSNCLLNEPDTNTCIIKYQNFRFYRNNKCTVINVSNCKTYDNTNGTCLECNDNYYLMENNCYQVNKFQNSTTDIRNCAIFYVLNSSAATSDLKYGCKECQSGFHFVNDNRARGDYNCISDSHVLYAGANSSTASLLINKYSSGECLRYDFYQRKCVLCASSHYMTNGICCTETKQNINGQCGSITLSNCIRAEFFNGLHGENQCLKCTATTHVLVDGQCCAAATSDYINSSGQCSAFPANCTKIDKSKQCSKCSDTSYLHPQWKFCCPLKQVHKSDGTCIPLTDSSLSSVPNIANFTNTTTECLQFDINTSQCTKCKSGYSFNGKVCQSTSTLFSNCNYVDPITKNCNECQDGFVKSDINICCNQGKIIDMVNATCVTTALQYTAIEGCALHIMNSNNDGYVCQVCESGKVLKTNICCYNYMNESNGSCVLPTYDYSNCLINSTQDQSCLLCRLKDSSNNDLYLSSGKCCPHKQYNSSGNCTALTDTNCLIPKTSDNNQCQTCADGYYNNNNFVCTAVIANCISYQNDGTCTLCKPGYVLNDTAASCIAIPNNYLEGCAKLNNSGPDDDKCAVCKSNYNEYTSTNGKYCCKLNYYYDTDLKRCQKIDDNNCATYDSNKNCTECFQNDNHCLKSSQGLTYDTKQYYLSNGKCVQRGTYYLNDNTQNIQLDNCLELNTTTNACTLCKVNYVLKNNRCERIKNCKAYIDSNSNNYYLSNNNCCKEGTYWDNDKQDCLDLYDTNCKESQDNIYCDKCNDNFVQQNILKTTKIINLSHQASTLNCPYKQYTVSVYTCLSTSIIESTNALTFIQTQQYNNCQVYDNDTKKCKVCKDNYYKINSDDICCQKNYVSLTTKEGNKFCQQISLIKNNCKNYDFENQRCLECNQNFTESKGRCCSDGTYFDEIINQCSISFADCKNYDDYSKKCLQCKDGYYFTNGICCAEGKVSTDGSTCTDLTNNCLIQDNYNVCHKCSGANYLTFGQCCAVENLYQFSSTTCASISTVFTTITNCNKIDEHLNCIDCKNTAPKSIYGKCCATNSVYNYDTCTVPTDNSSDNCLEYVQYTKAQLAGMSAQATITTRDCIKCESTHTLINKKCILTAQIFDLKTHWGLSTEKQNLLNENLNCLSWLNGNCNECISTKILSFNSGDSSITCQTGTSNVNNCHIYESNLTDCYQCKNGYRIEGGSSNPITCTANVIDSNCLYSNATTCLQCKDNYQVDSGDKMCKLIPIDYCTQVTSDQSQCLYCEEGYVLNLSQTKCIQTTTLSNNCLTGEIITDGTVSCKICQEGYYLDQSNSNACVAITTPIDNCKFHLKTSGAVDQCLQCQEGYRLVNSDKNCCSQTERFSATSSTCVDVLQFNRNCQTFEIHNTSDIDNTFIKCLTCPNNYYLVKDTCCKEGTYYNGSQCVTTISNGTQNCKRYSTNGLCKEINTQDRLLNCISGYLTFNRCCDEQKYFDLQQMQCVDIPNYLSFNSQNCAQVDEDMQCIKCNNNTTGRIYEGYCVGIGNYLELETLTIIEETTTASSFTNCSIIKDQKCLQCKPSFQLGNGTTSSQECCWDTTTSLIYNQTEQKCQTLAQIDCTTYDFTTKQCTLCANSKYFTGTMCCENQKFYMNGSCTSISTISQSWSQSCDQITDKDYQQKQCSKCIANTTMQNNLCCRGSFNIKGQCYEAAIQCSMMDAQTQQCIECQTGTFLSGNKHQKLCCPSNKSLIYVNANNLHTCTDLSAQTSISQCAQYLNTTECAKCNNTYILDNNKCCPMGSYNNNGTCTSVIVNDCIQFETKDSQTVCKQCKDNFNLYYYKNDNTLKSICCGDGKILDYKNQVCVNISVYTSNCSQVDIKEDYTHIFGLGPQCIESSSNSKYISNGVACDNNTYWNGTSCTTIPNAYPNCVQLSQGECLQCSNTTTHYIIGGQCCLLQYYNNNNTCTDGSTQNCKKFYNECPIDNDDLNINCSTFQVGSICEVCKDSHYLTYSGKCCADQSYYDSNSNQCKTYSSKSNDNDYRAALTNCKKFDKDLNCIECSTGVLSDDKQSCCTSSQNFVNSSKTCLSSLTVPTECKNYDGVNLICKECKDDNYLTDGICCANGKYLNLQTLQCDTINTTTLSIDTQCNQYQERGGCKSCNQNYLLNRKDQCIQIPTQCSDFDPDLQMCFECKTGFYLSEGICCQLTQYSNNGSCTNISNLSITNCNKLNNGLCMECGDGFYLRSGYCCQEGYYHDTTSSQLYQCTQYPTSGELKDCLQFGVDQHHCVKCKDNYVLITYDNYRSRCQKILTQTTVTHLNYKCLQYESTFSGQYGEMMQCTKCDQTGVTGINILLNVTTNDSIYYEETTNSITKPANCAIIDLKTKFNESSLKCVRCNSTHYLNFRNECIQRTNTNCKGHVPFDQDACLQCNVNQYLTLSKKCVDIPLTYCQYYDAVSRLCLQCDTSIQNKNIQLHYKLINGVLTSECVDSQLYDLSLLDQRMFLGYIDQCDQTDTDAVTNKFASNLEYYYDYFYNVHYCNNNKIPVSFVRMGIDQSTMPIGIGFYNKNGNPQMANYDLDDYLNQKQNSLIQTPGGSTQCINHLRDIFPYFTSDQYGTHLPSNCAMLMVNVSKHLSTSEALNSKPDLSELSAFCTSCKDGYKPKRNSRVPLHVYQCELISNCAKSDQGHNILNGCSACESGYAFGVNNNQVDYTQCISTSDVYCLATIDGTKCKFCKQGFMLNYDGKCTSITAPHCQDSQFSFTDEFNIKNFGFINDYLSNNKGCTNCDDQFIGIYQDKDRLLCAGSQTLVENNFTSDSLVYDAQCKFYGLKNSQTVCKQCNDNYLITTNNKCIAVGDMINCEIAIKTSECYQCKQTHVNVNKKCVEKTIENCKIYFNNPNLQTIQCEICEDGFLLKQNKCEQGHVNNCATYDDRIKCIKCKPNHVLTFMEGLQRCLLIDDALHPNCQHYNSDQFQENLIVCEQCSSDQYIVEDLFYQQDFCIDIPIIENCAIYDKNERLINSSFKCLECLDGYRLINNECIFFNDRDPNCVDFQRPGYQCLLCDYGYYLDQQDEKCIKEPTGVSGCVYYKNDTTCKFCQSGLYLQNNVCVQVPQENLIEFCKFYQNSENCIQCEQGKILQNNKCLEPIAQCLTYYNVNECRTCVDGQGIQIVDGYRRCVEIKKREFCDQQKNIDPFECIACTNGYYLDGGNCIQIQEPIVGCIQYDGAQSCSLCENGLVLSLNKTSCQNITFNDSCAKYEEVNPFCVYCELGYILRDGKCIQDTNISNNICLGYDSIGYCNVCPPGYTMNEFFECK